RIITQCPLSLDMLPDCIPGESHSSNHVLEDLLVDATELNDVGDAQIEETDLSGVGSDGGRESREAETGVGRADLLSEPEFTFNKVVVTKFSKVIQDDRKMI